MPPEELIAYKKKLIVGDQWDQQHIDDIAAIREYLGE